ncbi:HpcH/HpaI aldolase/citrate lyase family protein, partial [Kineococcus glutinatus]|uniref:HpcH/HpaI aldolase/citrate lyase family protein n=1 Tax=Kineococcus glutinatus TaxID=1070872 RepID=UPI0031E5FF9F
AKAAAAADVVVLDLEDAVAPGAKEAARRAVRAADLDPARTVVRLNPGGDEQRRDLDALAGTGFDVVMLAKAESAEQVRALAPLRVLALCETARGVLAAAELAAAGAAGLMWGAEDLLASLGGRGSRTPDGRYRDVARHARSSVLLAAGAHGVPAVDAVFLDLHDLDGLRAEAAEAAATGFAAKASIHPAQVPVVREAFRPPAAEVERARRLLAAAEGQRGVFAFEGRMVDAPLLRHAERVLRAAGAPG